MAASESDQVTDDAAEESADTNPSDEQKAKDPSGLLPLEKLTVTASVYKLPRTKLEVWRLSMFFGLKFDFGWPPLEGGGGLFVLTPGRLPQRTKNVAQTVTLLDSNELQLTPSLSVSGALLSAPEISLSSGIRGRTSDQGIALRGISALVLLDGVPINDPFDGTVTWTEIPREGLARAEVVSGGGATAWGNGALGGAVQFFTLPPKGKMIVESGPPPDGGPPDPTLTKQVIYATTQLSASIGSFDTQSAEFVTSQPTRSGVLQLLGRIYHSDGYSPIAPGQRGPIDNDAWSRNKWLEARWRQPVGQGAELVATIRGYDESFGNGTPNQYGSSEGTFASLLIAGNGTVGFAWNALAYIQHGSSANTFSAVDMDRTRETPLIDQFALPTTAFGANWSGAWRHQGDSRTNVGIDVRFLRGEVRENISFANGRFNQQLFAGGNQSFSGVFLLHDQVISPTIRVIAGGRIDRWDETNGHQRAIERATRVILRDDNFASEHGTEFSPSLGAIWQSTKAWRWRASFQQAFRRPVLAERYQASGNGSVVILANPRLRTERNDSFEIATDYSFYRTSSPSRQNESPQLIFGAKVFLNEVHDSVGNVATPRNPEDFPQLNTLPAGYRTEKRTNLDRARIQGLAFSSTWNPGKNISFEAHVLMNDAIIQRVDETPALRGKQMPYLARSTLSLVAKWKASPAFQLRVQARLTGSRFADSENTLPLEQAVIADFSATYVFNARTEFLFTAENIANCRIQTDKSDDGVFYVGAPRILRGGVKFKW